MRLKGERGVALGMVILIAVVFSIAAFTVLIVVLSQARVAAFYKKRVKAQYVAEAGAVWAMQQLWVNPAFCGPGSVTLNGQTATVTVSNCGVGNTQTVKSKVTY